MSDAPGIDRLESPAPQRSRAIPVMLLAGVLLIAANLRPALSSVSPILGPIGALFHLTGAGLTLLETIPIICFAVLAPASLVLQRRAGTERAMLLALILLAFGLCLRLAGGTALLFAGTALAGAAIAIANVLLPAIVKRDFAGRVGLVTGLYTTVLNAGAAIGAAISVPLLRGSFIGWRAALGIWAIPAVAGVLLWVPQLRHVDHRVPMPDMAGALRRLTRMPLAWQVAMFMGLQSLSYYAILSWLPAILESTGIAAAQAGLMLSLTNVVAIPVSLAIPSLATRSPDQRTLLAAVVAVTGAGFLGIAVAPGAAPWIWALLIGIGQGASFPLALTLIVLRAHGSAEAMSLSAFSQAIGYAVAIFGPLSLGVIHAFTASWHPPVIFLVATLIPQLLFGLAAARQRTIQFPAKELED